MKRLGLAASLALGLTSVAYATPATETSPTGGAVPTGVTKVGGIVTDLKGTNGTRIVAQLSAASLYVGFAGVNPQPFGTQTGFDAAVLAALGGGISSASFRITLDDGDNAPGNFDANQNSLLINGLNFGNWTTVPTTRTNADGTVQLAAGTGFANNQLWTGWFTSTDNVLLASLFGTLNATNALTFSVLDADPFDNFYDFTQGVDGGLINVGTGPIVAPGIPEPATWAMMILGFGLIGGAMRSARRQTVRVTYA